jgi:hypothetical protein
MMVVVRSIAVVAGAMFALLGSPVVLGSTEPPADETDGPRIEVVGGPDVDDLTFEVEGTGWPGNTVVQLELCGNRALNGSSDCITSTAQTVAANFQGWFLGRVSTSAPPMPCPCVVRALGQSGSLIATTPVRVAGVPEVDLDAAVIEERSIRRIGIVRARLEGGGSMTEWLGGSPERQLVLKLVNSGNVRVDDAVITMTMGSGSNPTGFLAPVAIEPLEVGETTTVEVDIEFDALTFGDRTVIGEVAGTSEPTGFRLTTTSYPWLLILIVAIIFQIALLSIRNAIRRRAFPEPVPNLPALPAPVRALPAGVSSVDDAVYLISMVKDVEAHEVMAIQVVLGQTSFIVPGDRTCGPTLFAVRGMEAVKELLTVVVDDARGAADAPITEMIDLVHVATIGGTTAEEARATAAGLASWLADELAVQVALDDPDEEGPALPPGCLRIASGPPPLMFRIELDDGVERADALAAADRVSNAQITARLLADDDRPFLCFHVADWTTCRLDVLYEQVANRVGVTAAAPVGLVPLGVLERIDPERWGQLGLELAGTYESRIAAGAPTEVSEVLGELALPPGGATG